MAYDIVDLPVNTAIDSLYVTLQPDALFSMDTLRLYFGLRDVNFHDSCFSHITTNAQDIFIRDDHADWCNCDAHFDEGFSVHIPDWHLADSIFVKYHLGGAVDEDELHIHSNIPLGDIGLYPLAPGNTWQYREWDSNDPAFEEIVTRYRVVDSTYAGTDSILYTVETTRWIDGAFSSTQINTATVNSQFLLVEYEDTVPSILFDNTLSPDPDFWLIGSIQPTTGWYSWPAACLHAIWFRQDYCRVLFRL